jgi:16S rRNA (guanine1207-N2)-methyltransferase
MSNTFSFQALRRFPDLVADNLVAVDATDRLVLAEAGGAIEAAGAGRVVVVGDRYGAMTLGAIALLDAHDVRVHQDPITGEQALVHNAIRVGVAHDYRHLPLAPELFDGATVVIGQLPKNLDALREIAQLAAAHADADVRVFLGGRVKHMTRSMNDLLGERFAEVRASLAHQKSRVLMASGPLPGGVGGEPGGAGGEPGGTGYPLREHHLDIDLWVCAHGAAFAGTKLDVGTRFLLGFLDQMNPDANTAVDLGCGTGVIAAALARDRPELRVLATDQSAAAVASAAATLEANGLTERSQVLRDDAMSTLPDASVDLILCNPPFHLGTSVHAGAALKLFDAAGRVLAPGGELWTVFNSHLAYDRALNRAVGSTKVVGRNTKFTVTVSTRR